MISTGCPQGFIQYGSLCYNFNTTLVSWFEARDTCQRLGAILAEPKTVGENTFIKDLFIQNGGSNTWLGASDLGQEGQWRWESSGDRMSGFNNWWPGQPDNSRGVQDCLLMYKNRNYTWDDSHCDGQASFVCQTASV